MPNFIQNAISIEQVQQSQGYLLLAFGTNWCGHCLAAAPLISDALKNKSNLPFVQEEDGAGRRLGRLFKVKLWPSFILLKDGEEIARATRPNLAQVLALLAHVADS